MPAGTVLVAHPSADLYGSDLQLVESVAGLVAHGWRVVVCVPSAGPLVARLQAAGATVEVLAFPVLRKAYLRPAGILALLLASLRALPAMVRRVRGLDADVVYVNTVTAPLWFAAARLARRPVIGHVHEAEDDLPRWLATALNAPLLAARLVVVNSRAATATLLRAVPRLERRTRVVYNGVTGPGAPVVPPDPDPAAPRRVALVGRLAPRKGSDVAVAAVALLRAAGRDVVLDLCGSVFPGYEWFEEQLRRQIADGGLEPHVRLLGYTSPTWPVLAGAEVVLVPSRAEPFGNAAVEGQLACRPVVASDVQGLREIVDPGRTGLLVPPGDAEALAAAIASLLDDPATARALAVTGEREARERFGADRYRDDIAAVVAGAAGRG